MAGNNHDKNKWINDLKFIKLKPILSIIDEVLMCDWKDKEKFYISKFRKLGCNLFNTSMGGEGSDSGNQTSFKPGNGSKRIVCLMCDGSYHKTFESTIKAAGYIGKHNISSVLKGVTKKAGGYIWIYEDRYRIMSIVDIRKFVENSNDNRSRLNGEESRFKKGNDAWNKKSVNQYTRDDVFIKTWESVKISTLSLGKKVNSSGISRCARGDRKTAFGYKWKY